MNWSGIRVLDLEDKSSWCSMRSLLSFSTRMGCCRISADKRQVCGEWKRLGGKLTGDEMKVYVGIDMAKDKFDYCAMDDTLNILCRGSNRENKNEIFKELSDLIRTLKSTGTMMKIGMESTGIYHIPLYNHLRKYGFQVRILNGLKVRGKKKSRIRKTTNDTIDAESIARYLMIREEKETFTVPENLMNLREHIIFHIIGNTIISHETVRRHIPSPITHIMESSGYFVYDEQYIHINGKDRYRALLKDSKNGSFVEEILADLSQSSLTGFFMRSFKRFIIPNDIFITTDGYHYVSFTLKREDSWVRE